MAKKNEVAVLEGDLTTRQEFLKNTLSEVGGYYAVKHPKNDEELEERVMSYFNFCSENAIMPMIEKLALAVGISKPMLLDWEAGRRPGTGPRCQEILTRAKGVCEAVEASAALEGKLNPVTYIFRGKNYYGMKDQQEMVVTPNTANKTREEIIAEANMLPDV